MNIHWTGPDSIGFSGHPRTDLWSTGYRPFINYKTWSYKAARHQPVLEPPLRAESEQRWVAVFVAADQIVFVPVLRVTSCSENQIGLIASSLTAKILRGHRALIASRLECRASQVVVDDNSESQLFATGVSATVGDYVIIAPAEQFSLMTILRVDVSTQFGFEWRNFTHDGKTTHSYTGYPIPQIVSDKPEAVDFPEHVSPLASGVVLSVQAYTSEMSGMPSAYCYLGRDSSHQTASIGLDRCVLSGAGVTGLIQHGFPLRKELWAKVNVNGTIGKLVVMGWTE